MVRRKMLDLYAEEVPDPSDCKFSGVLLLPGSAHGSADADDQQVSSMFPSTGSRAPVDGSSQRNSQRSTGTASAPSAVKRASGGSRGKSVPPLRVSGSGSKQENLCCDKCDGAHETQSCPYFKNPREKHQDAWSSLGKAKSLKSTDAEVVIVRNVRIIPQPGDGSCLFHSLSYGLGDRSTASSLRREISGFISKNPDMTIGDTFIKDWVGYDSNYQLTVHSYAQRMSGSSWGGGIEIAVFHKLKGVNVHVYQKNEKGEGYKRITSFDCPSASKTVSVLYQGGNHYDALEL